jgi:hypothetical protein
MKWQEDQGTTAQCLIGRASLGCKGNPVILRKSLRLAGGNPKNDISGYNT